VQFVLPQRSLHGSLHALRPFILLDSNPDHLEPVSPKKENSLDKRTNKFKNDAERDEKEPSTDFGE
jgi:hypothetical protein